MRHRHALVFLTVFALVFSTIGMLSGTVALASPSSPLQVQDNDAPDPVLSGAELTYSWTISNTGGAKVTDVVGTTHVDLAGIGVPPQLVITSSVGTCVQLNSTVTCNAGTLLGGQSWFVTIRGVVNAPAGTTLNNTVTVTGTKSAQTFSTSASATTLVTGTGPGGPQPDLTVAKTGPAAVAVSAPFSYTLTVNNIGSSNATNVRVTDTLPNGVGYIGTFTTSLFTCAFDTPTHTVTCDGGAVNAGANATITIDVTAPSTTGQIANNAVVDPLDAIVEGNELNNSSATIYTTIESPPPPPPFTIAKVQSSPSYAGQPNVVVPGDVITYTITANNISGYRADYDVLTDATQGLEASSLAVSAIVTGGGTTPLCSISAPNAVCSWTRWQPGASITMTVTGKVVAAAGATIIDTATIQGNVKNAGYSATTKLSSIVKPGVDLTITKSDAPDPVCARSWPASPAQQCTGGLTYTFVVGNSGITGATNVVVRDPLPVGSIFDSYTTTGGFVCTVDAANVVTCTGGSIPPESTREITLLLVAPPSTGTITNVVTVDPNNNIFESDETNNVASQTTVVSTGIDLVISKFDSPVVSPTPLTPGSPNGFDPIATSGTETYVIVVDNTGPQDAANIRVRDTLPAGTTFLSAEGTNGFTCSYAAGVVECISGHVFGSEHEFYAGGGQTPVGEDHAVITIRIFAQPVVGTMHNEVRVDPLNEIPEIIETNDFAFQDTTVATGNAPMGAFNQLTITKTQTAPTPVSSAVARNAVVTYDLKVENLGTDPASNVTVRDVLPAGARYISADDTNPGVYAFNCGAVGTIITCTGGTMNGTVTTIAGVSTTIRHITVQMFAPDTPGSYVNQAIVDPDDAIHEGNEFDNISNATLTVQNAGIAPYNELSVTKTALCAYCAEPDKTVEVGQLVSYPLVATNTGAAAAFGVVVNDVLPTGVTFVNAYDSAPGLGMFTCAYASGVVTCSGGTLDGAPSASFPDGPLGLAYPQSRTIIVEALAPRQHGATLLNTTRIDPTNAIPEGDETNNAAAVQITAKSFVDLTIKKNGPDSAAQSSTIEYTIDVTNDKKGPSGTGSNAVGVRAHDALPVGLIVLDVWTDDMSNNDWNCQVQENPVNVVDCLGDLGPGAKVTIHIKAFVTAADEAKLDNEACVDPQNTIVETDELNNCSNSTLTVGQPDVVVTKSALHNPVSPGDDQVYTIIATNIGTVAATAVTITDTLESGQTYVSAVGTNGFSCTNASNTVTCTYTGGGGTALAASGGSTTITLTAKVPSSAPAGPIHNAATASSVTPADANTGNNTGEVTTSVGGTGIDLQLLSAIDTPDPVQNAGVLTYTINVLNSGAADAGSVATPVLVRSTIDTGLSLITAVASEGFSCVVTGTGPIQIDCKNNATGVLAAGHTVTVTITGVVTAAAGTNITNEVKVDPNAAILETLETNNDATVVTSVVSPSCPPSPPSEPCIDLIAGPLLATADPVTAGDPIGYTFTATNAGNVSTTTLGAGDWVYLEIDVPAQVDYTLGTLSASSGFTCDDSFLPALYCWGNLNAGSGVVMSFSGTVNSSGANTIAAQAAVDPFFIVSEFDESNNTSSVSITRN